jgi:FMN phosphatase YigB (HAD superfamily)
MERTGIDHYFDAVISAHDYRLPKETDGFWQRLQDELGFKPDRTLLVEDTVKILEVARRFGIGHLVAITKPDSRAAVRSINGFTAIEHFGELLPGLS